MPGSPYEADLNRVGVWRQARLGSRGRGAVASTVLGSVASGLVHAAALPVLVVPGKEASARA